MNEGGVLPPDFHTRSVFSPRHLRSEVDSPYKKFKRLPPASRGSLEASYADSRLTKKPETFSSGPLSTKVDPKYQRGAVSLNVPVNNKYITSIGGSAGKGRSREKVKQSFLNDPVYEQVIERVHRNAALQLGLNPENLPLNLKNIGLAYNDYKEVLKNTVGEEVRGKSTGYGVEASFQTNPSGELILQFNKYPDRSKRGYIGFRSRFQDGGRAEEIKTLVEGGHDVEFAMDVEPYVKGDYLAQYGLEIPTSTYDDKENIDIKFADDMFKVGAKSKVTRKENIYGDAGKKRDMYSLAAMSPTNLKAAGLQIPFPAKSTQNFTDYELKRKPSSFVSYPDSMYVNLRAKAYKPIWTDTPEEQLKDKEDLRKQRGLATKDEYLRTLAHEARHKAMSELGLKNYIERKYRRTSLGRFIDEESFLRYLDWKYSKEGKEKNYRKRMLRNYTKTAFNIDDILSNERMVKQYEKMHGEINNLAKKSLESLRGTPVYEDKDYPESFMEKVNRKGIFATMFPYHFVSKEKE